jgi:hypothetical protein
LKKRGGGSREKGGGGNEIHAPCACDENTLWYMLFKFVLLLFYFLSFILTNLRIR